jgi:hypothetical protein
LNIGRLTRVTIASGHLSKGMVNANTDKVYLPSTFVTVSIALLRPTIWSVSKALLGCLQHGYGVDGLVVGLVFWRYGSLNSCHSCGGI